MTTPQPHPWIKELTPYKGGGYVPSQPNFWGLASNENLLGPSPHALKAYTNAADRIFRYPEQSGERLKREIASLHHIQSEQILLGNGSDEILSLLFRVYVGAADEVVLSQNGFPLFSILTQAQGAKAVFADEENLTTHVDHLLARVTPKTKMICIANPNNPTGTYISGSEVTRLCENTPSDVLIILDSAYAEYVDASDYKDGMALVERFPNVVMTRTFSKIYALAGLRLGWAYAHTDIVQMIERVRLAFHVNSIVQEVALAALGDQDFVKKSRQENKKWRGWLSAELNKLGLDAKDTATNFLLVHFPATHPKTAEESYDFLKSHHILTRPINTPHIQNCLRISTGPQEAMHAVVEKLSGFFNDQQPLSFTHHGP